ncbi:hypothetical protein [Mesorhizobium amorphae]|uniref:hypothetical protein n=1 Tax=Mesorhizobium amorphae TaxID=71433 RepID=UPI00178097F2|nr:hypothetical protein [Mesorhizobium amorphae]
MMAITAACAITRRQKMAKCEGPHHSNYDYVEASFDLLPADRQTETKAYNTGTPGSVLAEVVVIPFNDIVAMERVLAQHKQTLACVVIDPFASRAGLVPVDSSYLSLWEFAARHGILLISHEVPSFRLNLSFWTRDTQIALFDQVLSLSDGLGIHDRAGKRNRGSGRHNPSLRGALRSYFPVRVVIKGDYLRSVGRLLWPGRLLGHSAVSTFQPSGNVTSLLTPLGASAKLCSVQSCDGPAAGRKCLVNGTAVMICATPMPLPVSLAFEKPWTIIPTVQALSALLFLGVMSTAVVYVVCCRLVSLGGPA